MRRIGSRPTLIFGSSLTATLTSGRGSVTVRATGTLENPPLKFTPIPPARLIGTPVPQGTPDVWRLTEIAAIWSYSLRHVVRETVNPFHSTFSGDGIRG